MKSFFVYFSCFFRIFQSKIKMSTKNSDKFKNPNDIISQIERLW